MRKSLLAVILVVLLTVVALEAATIINIFKAKQNLDNIGIIQNID